MKISDIIDISIAIQARSPQQTSFDIPIILGYHNHYVDRVRSYTDLDGMVTDGFATDEAIYRAAAVIFSQPETINVIKVGRFATTPVAEIVTLTPVVSNQGIYNTTINGVSLTVVPPVTITPTAVNTTTYTVTIDGTVYTYLSDASATAAEIVTAFIALINADTAVHGITASGSSTLILTPAVNFTPIVEVGANLAIAANTATEIVTALKAAIAASTVAAAFVETGTSTLVLTATVPGVVPTLTHSLNLTLQVTDIDEGIATELTAIRAADDNWYAAVLTEFSLDDIRDAAAAIEATGTKVLFAVTGDADVVGSTYTLAGTDIGSILKTLAYTRTRLMFSRDPTRYLNAAETSTLRFDPGTATFALRQYVGIVPDALTSTEYANLLSKNVNSYTQVAGFNVTSNNGVQVGGMYTDVRVFADFLESAISAAVLGVLVNATSKVPYDDRGFSRIKGAVLGVLVGQERKDDSPLIPGSSFVTVPLRADVDDDDADARLLNEVKFGGLLSGAVHKVKIRGVLSL